MHFSHAVTHKNAHYLRGICYCRRACAWYKCMFIKKISACTKKITAKGHISHPRPYPAKWLLPIVMAFLCIWLHILTSCTKTPTPLIYHPILNKPTPLPSKNTRKTTYPILPSLPSQTTPARSDGHLRSRWARADRHRHRRPTYRSCSGPRRSARSMNDSPEGRDVIWVIK